MVECDRPQQLRSGQNPAAMRKNGAPKSNKAAHSRAGNGNHAGAQRLTSGNRIPVTANQRADRTRGEEMILLQPAPKQMKKQQDVMTKTGGGWIKRTQRAAPGTDVRHEAKTGGNR
jgi:hypothetical protein